MENPVIGNISTLIRYGACLQVAFALGRTIFINEKKYDYFGGLNNSINAAT